MATRMNRKEQNIFLKQHGYTWKKLVDRMDQDFGFDETTDTPRYEWRLFSADGRCVTIAEALGEIELGVEEYQRQQEEARAKKQAEAQAQREKEEQAQAEAKAHYIEIRATIQGEGVAVDNLPNIARQIVAQYQENGYQYTIYQTEDHWFVVSNGIEYNNDLTRSITQYSRNVKVEKEDDAETQATITNRALGDKPRDVCINPTDELVDIDMAKLATDTTPYTDIEAEMARAKQPAQTKGQYDANVLLAYAQARLATRGETTQYVKVLKVSTLEDYAELGTETAIFKAGFEDIDAFIAKQPAPATAILQEPQTCIVCRGTIERGKKASIVPGGFIHYRSEPCERTLEREHVERSRNTPTTAEFMDILNEISFQQFMASIQPKYALLAPPTAKPSETPAQPVKKVMTVVKWGKPYYGLTMKMTSDGRTEYNKWARMDKVTAKERRDAVWFVNHWDGKYAQVVNIAQTERRLVVLDAKQIASWFTPHKLSCGFSIDASKLETLKPTIAVYHAKWRTYEVNSLLSETLDKEYTSRMATIAGNALYGKDQPTRL